MHSSHEERECLVRVAELWSFFNFFFRMTMEGREGGGGGTSWLWLRSHTLPAMMASSGASSGACGARRAPAADASYALDVWRNSAVRSRACLAGDAGVVASK